MSEMNWEYENSISLTKKYTDPSDPSSPKYSAWKINRYFANFIDTIVYSNMMNLNPDLDPKLQYDFLFHSIRKQKRFFKSKKHTKDENLHLIQQYYKYSPKKSLEVLEILTDDQIETIRKRLEKGGIK